MGHQELPDTHKAATTLVDAGLTDAFTGPGIAGADDDAHSATLLVPTDDLDCFEHQAHVFGIDPVDFAV